jgi:hypothetical protein
MSPERKKLVLILVLVAIFDLLTVACVLFWWKNKAQEPKQAELATRLINLSAAVDAYFSGTENIPSGNDEEILRRATTHDPSLLAAAFTPYQIKVQRQERYAVLLLCTQDGKRAIMEDAGCSARLDRRAEENAPCEFTLKVAPGCQVTQEN